MFVLRELRPETAHDAVAGARQVRGWGFLAFGDGVQATEDELGAVHFGEVGEEVGAPWGGLGRGGVRGGGHGARELREAESGSYGCWVVVYWMNGCKRSWWMLSYGCLQRSFGWVCFFVFKSREWSKWLAQDIGFAVEYPES